MLLGEQYWESTIDLEVEKLLFFESLVEKESEINLVYG
jgi:hypothetical protein